MLSWLLLSSCGDSNLLNSKQIKEIMEHCIPELKVPSKVDIATGMNWGYTDDFKS